MSMSTTKSSNSKTPSPSAVAPAFTGFGNSTATVSHPDVTPREAILKALAVLHSHHGHMVVEDVKMLSALGTSWRKARKERELAKLPKVDDTVVIRKGSRLFIGKSAKVVMTVGTRVVVHLEGGGKRLFAASAVEKA